MKLWIDTDIGGDIDDALAILLALSHPEVELVGVSTVFGNTQARARIAKTILTCGGRGEVPVYAGEKFPLVARRVFHEDICTEELPPTYIKELFDGAEVEEGAVETLARALQRYDDLCVVTLGALTNLAKLIEKYPSAAKRIKSLFIMGAAVKWNVNEFNVTCDPEAADAVFESEIPKKIVSLDVTFRCVLSKAQIARLCACKSDCVGMVIRMSKLWGHGMILHDPLALAAALSDEFVVFRAGNLKVELSGEFSRGKCVNLGDFNWRYPPRKDMLLSAEVKNEDFTSYYVDKICRFDDELQQKRREGIL